MPVDDAAATSNFRHTTFNMSNESTVLSGHQLRTNCTDKMHLSHDGPSSLRYKSTKLNISSPVSSWACVKTVHLLFSYYLCTRQQQKVLHIWQHPLFQVVMHYTYHFWLICSITSFSILILISQIRLETVWLASGTVYIMLLNFSSIVFSTSVVHHCFMRVSASVCTFPALATW